MRALGIITLFVFQVSVFAQETNKLEKTIFEINLNILYPSVQNFSNNAIPFEGNWSYTGKNFGGVGVELGFKKIIKLNSDGSLFGTLGLGGRWTQSRTKISGTESVGFSGASFTGDIDIEFDKIYSSLNFGVFNQISFKNNHSLLLIGLVLDVNFLLYEFHKIKKKGTGDFGANIESVSIIGGFNSNRYDLFNNSIFYKPIITSKIIIGYSIFPSKKYKLIPKIELDLFRLSNLWEKEPEYWSVYNEQQKFYRLVNIGFFLSF